MSGRPIANPVLSTIHCLSLMLSAMEGQFWLGSDLKVNGNVETHATVLKTAAADSGWISVSPVSVFHVYLSDTYLRSLRTKDPQVVGLVGATPLQFPNAGLLKDGLVTELLLALSRSDATKATGDKNYIAALTESLARHIVRHYASSLDPIAEPQIASDCLFGRLLETIKANPAHPYTVESFSQMTGMSNARLTSNFKSLTGLTPYKYLLVQRLELAKRELEAGCASLSDLALRLGFVDQAHFSHAFRRYTGKTPGRARAPNRE